MNDIQNIIQLNQLINNIKDKPIYNVIQASLQPFEFNNRELDLIQNWRRPINVNKQNWNNVIKKKENILPKIKQIFELRNNYYKKNGILFYQFNTTNNSTELDDLLIEYRKFYNFSKNGKPFLTGRNILKLERKIREERNYQENEGRPSILSRMNTLDGLSDTLNNRINGFNKCIEKGEEYYVNEIHNKIPNIKQFYTNQKKKEKNIKDRFNSILDFIEKLNTLSEKEKKDLLYLIKKKKVQFISEAVSLNNTNIAFDKNKCLINETIGNIENQTKFEKLIQKYVIPQGNKVVLLGRIKKLLKYSKCKGLFHVLAGISPFAEIKSGQKVCDKYINYTLFYNRLYIAFALAKNMDIPIMICLNDKPPDKIIKYYLPTKNENYENKKFIGILDIPYYNIKERKLKNIYLFIFESNETKTYAHYNIITHFEIYNVKKSIIVYGTTSLRKAIQYDEIDALHWMYHTYKDEIKIYFYYDPSLENYIFVSTKPNLNDKNMFPSYNLKRIKLEKWYNNYGEKQYIIYNENQEKYLIEKGLKNKSGIKIRSSKNINNLNINTPINEKKTRYLLISENKN